MNVTSDAHITKETYEQKFAQTTWWYFIIGIYLLWVYDSYAIWLSAASLNSFISICRTRKQFRMNAVSWRFESFAQFNKHNSNKMHLGKKIQSLTNICLCIEQVAQLKRYRWTTGTTLFLPLHSFHLYGSTIFQALSLTLNFLSHVHYILSLPFSFSFHSSRLCYVYFCCALNESMSSTLCIVVVHICCFT